MKNENSKEILKVINDLIDIQWNSKGSDYDFYEKMINDLSSKLGQEKEEINPVR